MHRVLHIIYNMLVYMYRDIRICRDKIFNRDILKRMPVDDPRGKKRGRDRKCITKYRILMLESGVALLDVHKW